MKETAFINQNKKKWAKFERMSQQSVSDPDEIAHLFVEITDDLAYARTHYSKRSVRVYLNYLAQKVFNSIYKKKREPLSKLIDFWVTGLPLEMYRSRKALLTSFLVFAIGMLIGVLSTIDDPDFLGAVIGYDYVDLTESNIKNGKPMNIYGSGEEMNSFLMIGINNLKVALLTFVLGIFFSIGSSIFLFFNGIMVGAFQWFFKVRGLLLTSFLTIWIHGAFEIPAIILAGAAGITMGNGLMFPKTLTRMQSLSISAKRGVKIMIGIMPIIVIAAFIEGFATRHTVIQTVGNELQSDWPDWLKWSIIIFCFSFMVLYFVIYPFAVAKKMNYNIPIENNPVYIPKPKFEPYKIRTFGAVFSDTVLLYVLIFKKSATFLLLTLALFLPLIIQHYNNDVYGVAKLSWTQNMQLLFNLETPETNLIYSMGIVVAISLVITNAYYWIYKRVLKESDKFVSFLIKNSIKVFLLVLILYFGIAFSGSMFFLGLFFLPFFIIPLTTGVLSNANLFYGLQNGFGYASASYWKGLSLTIVLTLILGLIFWSAIAPIEMLLNMILDWFLLPLSDHYFLIKNIIWGVIYFGLFNLLLLFYITGYSIIYFSTKEELEAIELNNRLKDFGKHNHLYESEDEGEY